MAFSKLQPFSLNRRDLPQHLGILRLIALSASAAVALQWILPMISRVALNGGRVYENDEYFSLWDPLLPWPVFSVPAWLTIGTVAVACIAAALYLYRGGSRVLADMPYVVIVTVGLCLVFPWIIAALNTDPSGVLSTPGEHGYPIGWHWLSTPFVLLVLLGAFLGSRRTDNNGNSRRVASR